MAGVKAFYKKVVEATEEFIGALGNIETKVIRATLADRHHINRAFDLLGLTYLDWPLVESMKVEGGKKRKRSETSGKTTGLSKRGGHGQGCLVAPKVARVAAVKVATSMVSSESVVEPKPLPAVVLGARHARRMLTIADLPMLQVVFGDEDENEEEEKEVSQGSNDEKGDDSSSSNEGSEFDGVDDDDGDDDRDVRIEDSEDPCRSGSLELGLQGEGRNEEREVESCSVEVGAMPRHHCIHILREGHEIATDDDEARGNSRKHVLGDASHSGLRYFSIACGTNEPNIDLFTSPDLRGCHLIGTKEECQFIGGVYRRICMLKPKFLLCNESIDHLTEHLEVTGVQAIMLARAMRRRHGHIEMELQEQVEKLEKSKKDFQIHNKELKA